MESIAGKALQVSDAIISCQLDGKGGLIPIDDKDVINCDKPCWLHLNYTHRESAEWLMSTPLLPDAVRDALGGDSMRPRVNRLGDGTMITLRSVNLNTESRPDQLVVVRVFINDRLIVSTRQRKVFAIDEVLTDLQNGQVDLAFLDGTVASVYRKKLPIQDSYVFAGIDKLGFAFPKGSELRVDFDKYLDELGPEKRQAIIDKWMK